MHDFHASLDLKIPMHVKLAIWKACAKHLNKKCTNLVVYFTIFSHVFNICPSSDKHVKQCVKCYSKKMEFSISKWFYIHFVWKVHMHAKFAHFRQCSHGCQIHMVIHLKILHGWIILPGEDEKNGINLRLKSN